MTKLAAMIELFKAARLSGRYAAVVRATGLVLSCVAVLVMLWLPDLLTRTGAQLMQAAGRLKAFQTTLDEMERLKAKARPPAADGAILRSVLEATLGERLPGLKVSVLEANQVKVTGHAEFDSFVRWLGEVQSGHRLGVKTLMVEKQEDGASIELVLFAGGE